MVPLASDDTHGGGEGSACERGPKLSSFYTSAYSSIQNMFLKQLLILFILFYLIV